MDIFDIVGPIMIGPSSSHTAGACLIGKYAYEIAGRNVKNVIIQFSGSFAKTYKGHGTDKAVLAGLMGFSASDERLRDSLSIAKQNGLKYEIVCEDIELAHPNTVRITIKRINKDDLIITGASIGGGNIVITNIDGVSVELTGIYNTFIVVHKDIPGMISKITTILSSFNINVNGLKLFRNKKGGEAVVIVQVDDKEIDDKVIMELKTIDGVINAALIKALNK